MNSLPTIPALTPLLSEANHIDIKIVEGKKTLRAFISDMMNYQPGWVTFLYRVRQVFVRFLGMKQEGIPHAQRIIPADIPMTPGKPLFIFTVRAAKEDEYLILEGKDKHLDGTLGIVVKPLGGDVKRFYVVTIVKYNNWAGPIYFNVIRPFHHLIVRQMARAGITAS